MALALALARPTSGSDPSARYIAGVPWGPATPKLPQLVVNLTQDEAIKLSSERLRRLQEEAGEGAHIQLVRRPEPRTNSLIITGKKVDDVDAAHSAMIRMLHTDGGVVLAVHPAELGVLRKGAQELEKKAGCRLVVTAPKIRKEDADPEKSNISQVELLGVQAAQARAVQLLVELCPRVAELNGPLGRRGGELTSWSPLFRGLNIELHEEGAVARRRPGCCEGRASAAECVVSGAGPVSRFSAGRFWCFALRARDRTLSREFRGGTKIGVTTVVPSLPAPDCLLKRPECSWVLGRGVVRGPDLEPVPMPLADFDSWAEGDAVGMMVTSGKLKGQKSAGTIKIYKKPKGSDDWQCHLEWEAGVPDVEGDMVPLLELGGRFMEVEMLLPDMASGTAYGSAGSQPATSAMSQPLYLGPPGKPNPPGPEPLPPWSIKPPASPAGAFTGRPRPGRPLAKPGGASSTS